jgi:hypothetical protein
MADSIVGGLKGWRVTGYPSPDAREPEPSTHFDPRMNLTLRDMYHLSGDDKTGERVLPLLVAEDPKAGI